MKFWQADGPAIHYLGVATLASIVAGFIIGITAVANGPDDMQKCISAGGTWTHTLSQKETVHTYDHYDDKCEMPVKP